MLPEARGLLGAPCAVSALREGRMSLASDGARELLLAMATAHRAAQS